MSERPRLCAVIFILLFVSAPCFADSELSKGKFLVATHDLNDPRFGQTVILLIRYDTQGTVGLIVNLPTKIQASKAFPDTGFTANDLLYVGGPVDKSQFCLLIQKWSTPKPDEEEVKVVDNVFAAANKETIKKALASRTNSERLRLYVGYSGWSPGQLEMEIQAGAWLVYRGNAENIYDPNPSGLWQNLLEKASVVPAIFYRSR